MNLWQRQVRRKWRPVSLRALQRRAAVSETLATTGADFFFPDSSDGSSNNLVLSYFSSDKDCPIQWPQTSTSAARKDSFFNSLYL